MSANLNGIRAADRKGFFKWALDEIKCDVICLQEIKADAESIPDHLKNIDGYHTFYNSATKKGYSGVGVISKVKPQQIITTIGSEELDNEGRYLELVFSNFSIASLYFPSGTSGEDKQQKKFRAMNYYLPVLQSHILENKPIIICGDWNIAHQEIDLKNWKTNQNTSGFLPIERQWITKVLNLGYVDAWRHLYVDQPGYTWWSYRGNAYNKDFGWRIDYHMLSPNLKQYANKAFIYTEQRFSDHAPLAVHYDLTFKQ